MEPLLLNCLLPNHCIIVITSNWSNNQNRQQATTTHTDIRSWSCSGSYKRVRCVPGDTDQSLCRTVHIDAYRRPSSNRTRWNLSLWPVRAILSTATCTGDSEWTLLPSLDRIAFSVDGIPRILSDGRMMTAVVWSGFISNVCWGLNFFSGVEVAATFFRNFGVFLSLDREKLQCRSFSFLARSRLSAVVKTQLFARKPHTKKKFASPNNNQAQSRD